MAGECRGGDSGYGIGRRRHMGCAAQKIALVQGDEGRAAFDRGEQRLLLFIQRLGSVEHDEDESGVGEGLAAAGDAQLLGYIVRFAQSGGVDEFEWNAVEGDALAYGVARGAWGGRDDGALALNQAIEERAFAGIGA